MEEKNRKKWGLAPDKGQQALDQLTHLHTLQQEALQYIGELQHKVSVLEQNIEVFRQAFGEQQLRVDACRASLDHVAEVGAQNALNLRQHVAGVVPEEWSKAQLIRSRPNCCTNESCPKTHCRPDPERVMSVALSGDGGEVSKRRVTKPVENEEQLEVSEAGPGISWCLHCDADVDPGDVRCPTCGQRPWV